MLLHPQWLKIEVRTLLSICCIIAVVQHDAYRSFGLDQYGASETSSDELNVTPLQPFVVFAFDCHTSQFWSFLWNKILRPVFVLVCRLMAYILALSFYGIYLIRNKLWPIFGPACLEFVLIWASIIVKIVTDRRQAKEKQKPEHSVADDAKDTSADSNSTLQGDRSSQPEPQSHSVVELQRVPL